MLFLPAASGSIFKSEVTVFPYTNKRETEMLDKERCIKEQIYFKDCT